MLIPVIFRGYCSECDADTRGETPECPECGTALVRIEREDDHNYPITDADNQFRQKAIEILENIADKLGKPKLFDCKRGDSKWYDFEDMVVGILAK